MTDDQILYILEAHDFDTSLDWRDPEIGFSADELLAMAEWADISGTMPTIETRPLYYADDLHLNKIPDWMRHEATHSE